jgi:alpha-glucosidase
MNHYDAAALGEVGDAQRGLEILGEYTSNNDKVQMCYAFEFLANERVTASKAQRVLSEIETIAPDGWACWAFSNHDVQRHLSRWNLSPSAMRLHTTLMMCLRGSICLYQGEELGLPEAELHFEDLRDPYGIEFWPEFKGRDGCRTPMVWRQDEVNGGFSSGVPWLPVAGEHIRNAVATQEADPSALLHHYRRAIAFRHSHAALLTGRVEDLTAAGSVLSFRRIEGGEEVFCAFNLSEEPATTSYPEGRWLTIGAELNSGGPAPDGIIHLGPWQPCLAIRH